MTVITNIKSKTAERKVFQSAVLPLFNSGNDLLSHTVARAVPSALKSLTSVFEMGTGVTSSTQPPENLK